MSIEGRKEKLERFHERVGMGCESGRGDGWVGAWQLWGGRYVSTSCCFLQCHCWMRPYLHLVACLLTSSCSLSLPSWIKPALCEAHSKSLCLSNLLGRAIPNHDVQPQIHSKGQGTWRRVHKAAVLAFHVVPLHPTFSCSPLLAAVVCLLSINSNITYSFHI
jgi:hypothetical protein